MDEAVQCDFITYIAYGRKLIDGAAAEIPAMVGLHTWRAEGSDLAGLEEALAGRPGVQQVARFGSALQVSGTDAEALAASVKALATLGPQRWSEVPAGLEDAFIYLMAGARDNFSRDGR
jgi:ABC-2 type transport system ATP-binding protein